ncbi:MAG: lysine transporter LysE, partial [Thermodesulfovibrio sp.]|nr:lysine transporter LysE [Thermodesulfovibrio sp.]
FTGHVLGDLAWYSAASFGIDKGKKFLNDSIYRKTVFVCAIILMCFSFYFICSGIDKLKDFF